MHEGVARPGAKHRPGREATRGCAMWVQRHLQQSIALRHGASAPPVGTTDWRPQRRSDAHGAASCPGTPGPGRPYGTAGPPDWNDAERRGRHSHAERGNESKKPRTGRDSIARGAAKRSPGLVASSKDISPNGARFPVAGDAAWHAQSRPVGPARQFSTTDPGLCPGLSNLAPFGALSQRRIIT